ncbi:Bug family tripartite tricarboxylate transporter substrate binding protein [Noviherbaspirillum humi]|nr:tripartite tricarboxylate transporter substrate-binding protein [Noviherbaspirillum humi]
MRRFILKAGIAVAGLSFGLGAAAQERWPERPVKIVVPSSPGGGTDVFARILAQALGDQLKQTFIVENKPGSSGNIGADAVAKSAPDGYTILVASNASLAVNPGLYPKMPFDIDRDLTPVARGVMAPMVLVASPSLGIKRFDDLVAQGKSKPGSLFFGSAGVGSPPYIAMRMIEEVTGAHFEHVPYKGLGPAYQDLMGGQIQFMMADAASSLPFIASGRMIPLAVNDTSIKQLEGVPRFDRTAYGRNDFFTSFSVMAPARVPASIVQRLSREINAAMKKPEVASRLEQQALIPVFDTPAGFAADLKKERELWAQVIRRNKLTPEQ